MNFRVCLCVVRHGSAHCCAFHCGGGKESLFQSNVGSNYCVPSGCAGQGKEGNVGAGFGDGGLVLCFHRPWR